MIDTTTEDDNPYRSPRKIIVSENRRVPVRKRHPVGIRHLVWNFGLFVAYSLGGMLFEYVDVTYVNVGVQVGDSWGPEDYLLDNISFIFIWSSVPVALYANWRLTRIDDPINRAIVGLGMSLVALILAFVPFNLILIWFRVHMGGQL